MPPRKGRKAVKKESDADLALEPATEDMAEEHVELDHKAEEVELVEEPVDTGLNVDMDVDDKAGSEENDLTQDTDDPYGWHDADITANVVDPDNLKVDLGMEEPTGEMFDEYVIPAPPEEDEEHPSNEELTEFLNQLLESLMEISREVEEQEEEEEEGAIREDEVPFERLPDNNQPERGLLVLNVPPEFESKRVVEAFGRNQKLVVGVTTVDKTKLKVFFNSEKVAAEVKKKLDNLKVYNRRLQALYTPEPVERAHPNFNYHRHGPNNHVNHMHHVNHANHQGHNRHNYSYPGLPNNLPGFNIPPPPTTSFAGPRDEPYKVVFNRYKLLNSTLRELLVKLYKEINYDPRSEGLLWVEGRSFFENQLEFDRLYERTKMSTRYVMVGNLKAEVFVNANTVHEFMAAYTTSSYLFEVMELPASYPLGGDDAKNYANETVTRKWLYLVFDKNRDGSNFHNKLAAAINSSKALEGTGNDPMMEDLKGLQLKYSCPVTALSTLWVGNVCEFCGYFESEDDVYGFFSTLGVVRNFKLMYDGNCIFVTYQNKEVATKIYNFLHTMSPKRVIKMINTPNSMYEGGNMEGLTKVGAGTHRVPTKEGETNDMFTDKDFDLLNVDFSIGRSENSYTLGQKLLNAIKSRSDSAELIDKLLNNEAAQVLPEDPFHNNRRFQPQRRDPRDMRRRDRRMDRFERRPPRDSYRSDRDREYGRFRQRHPIAKDRERDRERERERRVDRFGRTIRDVDRPKPEEPWKQQPKFPTTPTGPMEVDDDIPLPPEPRDGDFGQPPADVEYCQLLKRGKPIFKVSCVFVRGDRSHRLPDLLDVNQRANPERLKNYLSRSPELSLWQLGAESSSESSKYDSLCDYLISKNRVALVQQGPYEIYIVPPQHQYVEMLNAPDSQFMYAYILSKSS